MAFLAVVVSTLSLHGQEPVRLEVHWDKNVLVSKTTPTFQTVVNPPLRPGGSLRVAAYQAVKELGADYVRYVPWFPYPRLAVAELEAPTAKQTSWDFSLIDPMTKDFLAATEGHPTVMNFSTIPAWLFRTKEPVTYPSNADEVDWNYTQGTELRDASGKELADYYGRLVSWYVDGGFTDENGRRHVSGYHHKFPVWEVLNEVDAEHTMTPEEYTKRYDAIVEAIHRVSPSTKFMGLALAAPRDHPEFFEYFLNPAHHKPGIPLDYISYHFYASPTSAQTIADWQYTFFDQADGFLSAVRFIESIRQRLSPSTKTDLDELGVILPTDNTAADKVAPAPAYYNLAGSLYAYLFVHLTRLKIDAVGESQLVGYPTQYPSVSMMDWQSGRPNARFWVLKLIKDNFHAGDMLVETKLSGASSGDVAAQGFVAGKTRKLLLINKRDRAIAVKLPASDGATARSVDGSSGEGPARGLSLQDDVVRLEPFAVTVVSW